LLLVIFHFPTSYTKLKKPKKKKNKGSLYGLAIYIKKYLKAKEEELGKFKYFTMQKYNLQKKTSTRNQNPQDIITLKLISSFNTSPNIIFQESSYKK